MLLCVYFCLVVTAGKPRSIPLSRLDQDSMFLTSLVLNPLTCVRTRTATACFWYGPNSPTVWKASSRSIPGRMARVLQVWASPQRKTVTSPLSSTSGLAEAPPTSGGKGSSDDCSLVNFFRFIWTWVKKTYSKIKYVGEQQDSNTMS